MPKRKGVIEPIDAPFDEVVNSIVEWPQDQPSHIENKNMPQEESGTPNGAGRSILVVKG